MNVIIVEDELLAAQRIELLLKQYDSQITVMTILESVEESVNWMKTKPHPDLFLMDIHLSDGHCFEIFKQTNISKPVIFTTAYDEYALEAFKHFGIDYLLKPVSAESLATAFNRYKVLSATYKTPDYSVVGDEIKRDFNTGFKERFLAKIGTKSFFIECPNIAYFSADNKIVYLHDNEGNRFTINHTMDKLESVLNPRYFFRINRKYILHSSVIHQIKPYFNNRLKLTLKNLPTADDMLISRERVSAFRAWAEG